MSFPLPDPFVNDPALQRNLDAIRKALGELRATTSYSQRPQARVTNTVAISIPTGGSGTVLTFDTERWDTTSMHSTTADTSRLTCVTPGLHAISGNAEFAGNSTGRRLLFVRLNAGNVIARQSVAPNNTGLITVAVTTTYRLAVGDYVELLAFQDSGVALDVNKALAYSPEFSVAWLSP